MGEFGKTRSRALQIFALLLIALVAVLIVKRSAQRDSITGSFEKKLAAKVPEQIRERGSMIVAIAPHYSPNEFIAEDGITVIGTDADLIDAIGRTLDLKVIKRSRSFDEILPGLVEGEFDVAISSLTDTKERERLVDMVTYMMASTSFYTSAKNPVTVSGLEDLCGKTVGVQKGTVQQREVEAQNEKCTEPISIRAMRRQTDVDVELAAGRIDLTLADTPVADYTIRNSSGRFQLTGGRYDSAPYGIAVSRTSGLTEAVHAAVEKLIENGTYAAILKKWDLASGAIAQSEINEGN